MKELILDSQINNLSELFLSNSVPASALNAVITTASTANANYFPNNTNYSFTPAFQALNHDCYWSLHEDKTSKAFKVIQKLMDIQLIKVLTVKKFIDLVNEISGIL